MSTKVLHLTPGNKYEEVELLAYYVNEKNHFSPIKHPDGSVHWTGGLIFNDTPQVRAVLDTMTAEEQHAFVWDIKVKHFPVPQYFEEVKEIHFPQLLKEKSMWDKFLDFFTFK